MFPVFCLPLYRPVGTGSKAMRRAPMPLQLLSHSASTGPSSIRRFTARADAPVALHQGNTPTAAFVHLARRRITKPHRTMREFYQQVAATICRHTGFNEVQLLHDRHELTTDARHLLMHLLGERLTNQDIVHLTHLPKQTVSRLLNGYRLRAKQKYSLRCLEMEVRKELEGSYE